MPSELIGRDRKLTWKDFSGRVPAKFAGAAAAVPDKTNVLAQTDSSFEATFGGIKTPNLEAKAGGFGLANDVKINIIFTDKNSWKIIDHLSANGSAFLLDHEQGHYNITALVARDCFIEVMQCKEKTYATEAAGRSDVLDIITANKGLLRKIQDKYDDETLHGQWVVPTMHPEYKSSFQVKWEGFINQAFTTGRVPEVVAPNGAIWKKPLIDVLRDAGVTP
jgi:hypothetical protein